LIELLVILAVVAVLCFVLLPALLQARQRARRISCVSNLMQIGLAARTFEMSHNDGFPWQVLTNPAGVLQLEAATNAYLHFLAMSNELATPKILVCPADAARSIAKDFATLSNTNVSYFVGLDAKDTTPEMLLAGDRNLTNGVLVTNQVLFLATNRAAGWTRGLHSPNGNIGLADGSVKQVSTLRLREAVTNASVQTRLLMP
jgi:type II secretory pathway pseudopilin PulG